MVGWKIGSGHTALARRGGATQLRGWVPGARLAPRGLRLPRQQRRPCVAAAGRGHVLWRHYRVPDAPAKGRSNLLLFLSTAICSDCSPPLHPPQKNETGPRCRPRQRMRSQLASQPHLEALDRARGHYKCVALGATPPGGRSGREGYMCGLICGLIQPPGALHTCEVPVLPEYSYFLGRAPRREAPSSI